MFQDKQFVNVVCDKGTVRQEEVALFLFEAEESLYLCLQILFRNLASFTIPFSHTPSVSPNPAQYESAPLSQLTNSLCVPPAGHQHCRLLFTAVLSALASLSSSLIHSFIYFLFSRQINASHFF